MEKKQDKKEKSIIATTTKIILGLTVVFVGIGILLMLSTSLFPKLKERVGGWLAGYFNPSVQTQQEIKLTNEENVVIDVVEKAKDSVVSVALDRTLGAEGTIDKIGTGFVVDSSGLIITNQHVVSLSDEKYKVITANGKSFDVEDIIIDDNNDIALLKVKAEGLKALSLGDSSKLKVGQLVIAIGTPLGEYAGSVTTGIVSGLNRSVATRSGSFWSQTSKQYEDVIQTDAAINPGNSGGPLLNSSGEVIGVNFATTSGADNISFALPSDRVKVRLEEYRKFGKFIKPYLGVEYRMITELDTLYYTNLKPGALVVRVVANSPASKAGIKKDDIITKFAGKDVTAALYSYIQAANVGEEVKVEVYREGKTVELSVKLEEAK